MFRGLEQDFPRGQRRNEIIAFVVLCKGPRAVITATLMGLTVQPGSFSGFFVLFKEYKTAAGQLTQPARVHILQREHSPDVNVSGPPKLTVRPF